MPTPLGDGARSDSRIRFRRSSNEFDPAALRLAFGVEPCEEATRKQFRAQQIADVLELPPAERLVGDVLFRSGPSIVAGQSGAGKSAFALMVALSVAAGRPLGGHEVTQGPVLYIAAEGFRGLSSRVQAWLAHQQLSTAATDLPAFVIGDAPQVIDDGDVDALLRCIEQLQRRPVLIVVDTMARTFVGCDDNSGRDVGLYVAGVDRLQRESGAHVLVVHHAGWSKGRERGHTALRAAAETVAFVTRDKRSVTVSCLKQREAAAFSDLRFEMCPTLQSFVLVPPGGRSLILKASKQARQKVLDALRSFGSAGASFTEWRGRCETNGITKVTFNRARADLVSLGSIRPEDKKWRIYNESL